MPDNDDAIMLSESNSLISDEYYFKYIFKKTEKIICAVFFILNKDSSSDKNSLLTSDIQTTSLETLAFVSSSLSKEVTDGYQFAHALGFRLIALESKLRVLHASGILHTDHLNVFTAEIDSVLRSAKNYEPKITTSKTPGRLSRRVGGIRPGSVVREKGQDEAPPSQGHEVSRRDRIVAVLKAQPGASIKDISDTVKDCSEKTIQRELIELISINLVRKDGERRWSKYTYIGQ